MRTIIAATLICLAACGPSTQSSDDAPSDNALPYGAIIAQGERWQLLADPASGGVSFSADDGAEVSGPWSPPQSTAAGHVLSAGDINATLTEQPCTVYDMTFPMRADVTVAGHSFQGCATMRWDYQLMALMPAIDACIALSPGTRVITYAAEIEPDVTLVRMQGGGAFADCRVADGVASTGHKNGDLRIGGEHAALFLRGPGGNPGGDCYDAPEVRGADGEVLGWMMDPMGC